MVVLEYAMSCVYVKVCVTGIEVKLDKGVRLGELADRDSTAKTDTAASELIETAKLNKVYPLAWLT